MTIEFVREGPEHLRAGFHRAIKVRVRVGAHQAELDRRPTESLRRFVELRILVREHEQRAIDRQFGVSDLAALGIRQARPLLGSEGALVEFDRRRAVVHSQCG